MTVPGRYTFLACALVLMSASPALADCYGCDRPQRPPEPPPACHSCATPPVIVAPPSIAPPPGVRVSVGAEAQASATSIAISHARSGDVVVRTGGGGYVGGGVSAYAGAGAGAVALAVAESSSAVETLDRSVLLEAACIDASGGRFHAAQTFAAREVGASYSGELFRCWTGARLQYMSEGGALTDCGAGESLWYAAGALRCAPQTVRGDANAMLRRFGAGAKMVRLAPARAAPVQPQMLMDGGVGGGW